MDAQERLERLAKLHAGTGGHLPASAQDDGFHTSLTDQALDPIPEVCVEPAHAEAVLPVGVLNKVIYFLEVVLSLKYKGMEGVCKPVSYISCRHMRVAWVHLHICELAKQILCRGSLLERQISLIRELVTWLTATVKLVPRPLQGRHRSSDNMQ